MVITVKGGLNITNGNTVYTVARDVSFVVSKRIEKTDITQNVTINGWETTGMAGELTYARISLGKGVMPAGVEYDIMDKQAYIYMQEYILVNGKTVAEINATTDTSNYVFSTFPSTEDKKYQLPIIIFVNGDTMELKIHNDYLATLEGTIEITIKEGFYVRNGDAEYVVGKDIRYILAGKIWADKDKQYTITYFINGEQYGDAEVLPYNSLFVLRDDPEIEDGYSFSGWEYDGTTNVVQDMQIHAYVRPVQYSVTYHLNGGINDPRNPIIYCVTDGVIVLKDATKEGATFKGWYTSEDYSTKVENLSPDKLGDIELYALFEETGASGATGCGSITYVSGGLLPTLGLAFVLKKRKKKEK